MRGLALVRVKAGGVAAGTVGDRTGGADACDSGGSAGSANDADNGADTTRWAAPPSKAKSGSTLMAAMGPMRGALVAGWGSGKAPRFDRGYCMLLRARLKLLCFKILGCSRSEMRSGPSSAPGP